MISFASLKPCWKIFLICTFPVLLSGCSVNTVAVRSASGLLEKGARAFYEESDVRFAGETIGSNLKLAEILLQNDPENIEVCAFAAQGFGSYAFLFLEDAEPERAKVFYERGLLYGLRALKNITGADFRKEINFPLFDKDLKRISKKNVPALFWTAYCWGGLANLSRDNPDMVADLPKIERMMARVNQVFPGYFYGGADLFLGAYDASRPKMLGGSPEKAKDCFDRAVKVSEGRFLTARMLYARHYAVAVQDRALYETLLKAVLDFSVSEFPEQRLSNAVAQMKAKKLLEDIDEHF